MRILVFTLLFITISFSQYYLPRSYNLNESHYFNQERELISIIDLRDGYENNFYLGTSSGLYVNELNDSLINPVNDSNLPVGGNPALKTYSIVQGGYEGNDNYTLIIVSGVDVNNENQALGTGISWSLDGGSNWQYIEQPLDEADSANYVYSNWYGQDYLEYAWTSLLYNISYDVSADIQNEYIYAASWAGKLKRFNYTDQNPFWESVPLPMDNQNELNCHDIDSTYIYNPLDITGNNNHKAFSVHIEGSTIWCGTADGINKGEILNDGCIDWIHYNVDNTNAGLGGNWVVSIHTQGYFDFDMPEFVSLLYAVSWNPDLSPHKLSYTNDQSDDDLGTNWYNDNFFEIEGGIIYNLLNKPSYDFSVFSSTSIGLWNSTGPEPTSDWNKVFIPQWIFDQMGVVNENDDNFKVYSSLVKEISSDNSYLWIGTNKGLIATNLITSEYIYIPEDDALIAGCMDETACNYNPDSTVDNGTCDYPLEGFDCDGNMIGDLNGDGIINVIDITEVVNIIINNEYNHLADIINDGIINVLDIIALVNIIIYNNDDEECEEIMDCMCESYITSNTNFNCDTNGNSPYAINEQLSCETLDTEFSLCYPENCETTFKLSDFEDKIIWIIYEADW